VIHVDDLSRGLLLGLTQPAASLGTTVPRFRLPLWPFTAAALLMELSLRPLGIKPPLHRRRLGFFTKSFQFSVAKASRELGFTPSIAFADGSRDTARWYAEQALL